MAVTAAMNRSKSAVNGRNRIATARITPRTSRRIILMTKAGAADENAPPDALPGGRPESGPP